MFSNNLVQLDVIQIYIYTIMLYLYYKTYEYRELERKISIGEIVNEKRKDGIVDWVMKLGK